MNNQTPTSENRPTTYSMIVRSEEKQRGLFEVAVFLLFIAAAAASIWQFAHQPLPIPDDAPTAQPAMAQAAVAEQPGA